MRFLAVIAALIAMTCPANAGPFAALIPIVIGLVIKSVVWKIVATIVASAAVSLLTRNSKKVAQSGISIETTLTGGTNPRTLLMGFYATAGSLAAPPMSYGEADKTKNAFLVKVIDIADVAISGLSRIIINGEYIPLTLVSANNWDFGGKYEGYGSVRFHDGTQTTADATLVGLFAGYIRPWTVNHVGRGVAYAICTFKYNQEIYKKEPDVRFEVHGMPLYDVRKDTTAGGSGGHTWGDPTTYEYTENPVVMIYNILRGITLADGSIYGGECAAEDLPLANWAAAMNLCDEEVTVLDGTEPRYRAGYEFTVDDEPADVIEELLKTCSGVIVESGGSYKVRVGPPGLPVMFVTDDDFITTKEQDLDPFPPVDGAKNTVRAVYPSPDDIWAQHDAPSWSKDEYLERDGGMEFAADLQFPSCPFPIQVQRNMMYWLDDDARFRRHTGTLSHRGFILEPIYTLAWNSNRNGYVDKLFEITMVPIDLYTLMTAVSLREVDPDDYDWSSDKQLPDPVATGGWELPEAQGVPGFAVNAWSIKDDDGTNRRPAIRITWNVDGAEDATVLWIEVRLASTQELFARIPAHPTDGEQVIDGVLPQTGYEARARYQMTRPAVFTDWIGVITGDIKLGAKDLDFDAISAALGPSMVLPFLTRPIASSLVNSILNAATNDIFSRGQRYELDKVKAINGTALAAVREEAIARADADGVLAADLTTVEAKADNNAASITVEQVARIDGDNSLAGQITTVNAKADGNTASIVTEQAARINGDNIVAGQVTTVTARLDSAGGAGVTVEQAFIAQASDIDGLSAQYAIRINNNGRVSGFGLASGAGGTSEFAILADRFVVIDPSNDAVNAYPFQVTGGAVLIRNALIQNLDASVITVGTLNVQTLIVSGGLSKGYVGSQGANVTVGASAVTYTEIFRMTIVSLNGTVDVKVNFAQVSKADSGTYSDCGWRIRVASSPGGTGSYTVNSGTYYANDAGELWRSVFGVIPGGIYSYGQSIDVILEISGDGSKRPVIGKSQMSCVTMR